MAPPAIARGDRPRQSTDRPKKMAAKRRKWRAVAGAVVVTLALLFSAWLIVGAATDAGGGTLSTVVNVDPATQVVTAGTPFSVAVVVENVTELGADQATLHFDPNTMSVSQVTEGDFLKSAGTTYGAGNINNSEGYVTFFYALNPYGANVSGSGTLATINFTTNLSAAESTFALTLTDVLLLNGTGSNIPIDEVAHGTVTISAPPRAILDTGSAGTYPSISGTHNGTITPNQTITVSKMYTYPCPGTGGHSEYVRIWNITGWNVTTATWNGYQGDWHNISFPGQFTLEEGKTYNYTIRTSSYPQIIHKPLFNATGGTITCTNFTDANGKTYTNWVPAIKLFL